VSGALDRARAPRPEDRDLLRQRALLLARRDRPRADAEGMTAVLFELGSERYVLDAAVVLQVGVLRELTPLPGAVPPLLGVTYWRGQVLTVLDLRGPLGVQVRGLTDMGRLIVVEGPDHAFGILADAVTDMLEVPSAGVRAVQGRDDGDASLLGGVLDDATLVLDAAELVHRFGTRRVKRSTGGRGG
jgi:purine-binding chemotaxis protein CheW